MAYIPLDESIPGIRSLLAYFPAIEPAMKGLMQTMMRQDRGLNKGERELIAAWVSHHNHCTACENIHGAVASHLLGWDEADYAKVDERKGRWITQVGGAAGPRPASDLEWEKSDF